MAWPVASKPVEEEEMAPVAEEVEDDSAYPSHQSNSDAEDEPASCPSCRTSEIDRADISHRP